MAKAIPTNGERLTPSDTVSFPTPGTIWVNGYGNINVLLADQDDSNDPEDGIIFEGVTGDFSRAVKKVFATSTTISSFILDK